MHGANHLCPGMGVLPAAVIIAGMVQLILEVPAMAHLGAADRGSHVRRPPAEPVATAVIAHSRLKGELAELRAVNGGFLWGTGWS